MKAAWIDRHRYVSLVVAMALLIGAGVPAASAPDESLTPTQCAGEPASPQSIRQMLSSLVDWLLPYASAGSLTGVNCLTAQDDLSSSQERRSARASVAAANPPSGEIPLNMDYTLSGLMAYDERPAVGTSDAGLQLRFGENISLLARHLDVTQELMRTVWAMSGAPAADDSFGERVPQELALQLGNTTLEAKADFMSGLTQYLARSLMNADVPLPESGDDVTLVFNMNDGVSGLDISTVLQQTQQADGLDNPLNIGEITVRISNGNVTSEAELDPAEETVQIKRGKFAVNYHFGSHTLTSTTTFNRGDGVEEQRFQLTAQLGSVDFTGQALLFNNSGLQEFKLEAFWEGLTFSTLLTPQGFQESSFGLDLEF